MSAKYRRWPSVCDRAPTTSRNTCAIGASVHEIAAAAVAPSFCAGAPARARYYSARSPGSPRCATPNDTGRARFQVC